LEIPFKRFGRMTGCIFYLFQRADPAKRRYRQMTGAFGMGSTPSMPRLLMTSILVRISIF
jgi:hypothetical protein